MGCHLEKVSLNKKEKLVAYIKTTTKTSKKYKTKLYSDARMLIVVFIR